MVVVNAGPLLYERLAADGAGVALVLQHLVKPGLGEAEPGEIARPAPACPGLWGVESLAAPTLYLAPPAVFEGLRRTALCRVPGTSGACCH
jgi:hypothetical protein